MVSTPTPSNCQTVDKSFTSSLSAARFAWRNHTTQINPGQRSYSFRHSVRDRRTCTSCYSSPHPRIGAADKSNTDEERIFGVAYLCPPCAAARHDRGQNRWTKLGASTMEQVDIVQKTRNIFRESGRVPQIHEVDPFAAVAEIDIPSDSEEIQESEHLYPSAHSSKQLRAFFAQDAFELFTIPKPDTGLAVSKSDSTKESQGPDAQAQEILSIGARNSLPWIRFSPEFHKSLNHFLDIWLPSKTSQSDIAWICIDNPRRQEAYKPLADIDILKVGQVWEDMCASDETPPDIVELGQQFNDLAGKWLVFVPSFEVDHLWYKIARATHAGTLGSFAKVSPFNESDHVICVFTDDFTNVSDVNKVRNGLERLGVKTKIGYKPDIYTHCRIYMGNKWNIAPTRYHG